MTPIIFRQDKQPTPDWVSVFALFPTVKPQSPGNDCVIFDLQNDYQDANFNACIEATKAAEPLQAIPIYKALVKGGHDDLIIIDTLD